jgi:hypothetical protein
MKGLGRLLASLSREPGGMLKDYRIRLTDINIQEEKTG